MMAKLARARQAKVDPQTIRYYAMTLNEFDLDVIEDVVAQFESEVPGQYAPRFPDVQALVSECRKLSRPKDDRPRFFCSDCESESGLLYFDSPLRGSRLRGAALVDARSRYARPCPCGGTEHDWMSMQQDRAAHPGKYFTLADVYKSVNAKRAAQGKPEIGI